VARRLAQKAVATRMAAAAADTMEVKAVEPSAASPAVDDASANLPVAWRM